MRSRWSRNSRCFPVLFQASATGDWRTLFMSIYSTYTYSRDVLLSIRNEVFNRQYFPTEIFRDAVQTLPPSCLRVFKFSALNPRSRKLFSNLSRKSPHIRRFLSACKFRCVPRLSRAVSRSCLPLIKSPRQTNRYNRSTQGLLPIPRRPFVQAKSFLQHRTQLLSNVSTYPPTRVVSPHLYSYNTDCALNVDRRRLDCAPIQASSPANNASYHADHTASSVNSSRTCAPLADITRIAVESSSLSIPTPAKRKPCSSTLPSLHRTIKKNLPKLPKIGLASSTRKTSLKFTLFNVRSLKPRSLLINEKVTNEGIDCFLLTETWLTQCNDACISECCPSGFSLHHVDRKEKAGGGVGVISHDSLA